MLCIGTLPALAAQDLSVQFNPSIRQGLRYTYVEIYRIDVLQYTAELSAGVNFLIGPVIISPQISFLLVPPPAVDPTIFSVSGETGAPVLTCVQHMFFLRGSPWAWRPGPISGFSGTRRCFSPIPGRGFSFSSLSGIMTMLPDLPWKHLYSPISGQTASSALWVGSDW